MNIVLSVNIGLSQQFPSGLLQSFLVPSLGLAEIKGPTGEVAEVIFMTAFRAKVGRSES